MLNMATCIISDSIKKEDKASAFVYGFYSFFDKLVNGLFVFIVTTFWLKNEIALRCVMAFMSTSCSIIAFFFSRIGRNGKGKISKSKMKRNNNMEKENEMKNLINE